MSDSNTTQSIVKLVAIIIGVGFLISGLSEIGLLNFGDRHSTEIPQQIANNNIEVSRNSANKINKDINPETDLNVATPITPSYDDIDEIVNEYKDIKIDCNKEATGKLSLLNENETIIKNKADYLFEPPATTYEWYPQLMEGRFSYIRIDLKNEGCTKIIPSIRLFIFDENKRLVHSSKEMDSKYLREWSGSKDIELYPDDVYSSYGNIYFPVDGGKPYNMPNVLVTENIDYYLFLQFIDEKIGQTVGAYKFRIPKQ